MRNWSVRTGDGDTIEFITRAKAADFALWLEYQIGISAIVEKVL